MSGECNINTQNIELVPTKHRSSDLVARDPEAQKQTPSETPDHKKTLNNDIEAGRLKIEDTTVDLAHLEFSEDGTLLRRFNVLNTRVLLSLQDAIARKEALTAKIDEENESIHFVGQDSIASREECQAQRKITVDELTELLRRYSEYSTSPLELTRDAK